VEAFTEIVAGLAFPESARWHDGELFFAEKRAERVRAWSPTAGGRDVATVPGQPGGIGWDADGRLLVVSSAERALLRQDPEGMVRVADLTNHTVSRANDMVVDTAGRAYVGHFGYDLLGGATPAPASLVLVETDGSVSTVADDLHFPNGCVISPDGTTMILAETAANRLTAFTVAPDGRLDDRRLFAERDGFFPDGIALDAEGAVWAADPVGRRVVRVREGGTITDDLSTAPNGAFACALGGADGRTLFVCLYDERSTMLGDSAPASGSIVATTVTVPAA
jgi:sugar lactone lactonase YvrE